MAHVRLRDLPGEEYAAALEGIRRGDVLLVDLAPTKGQEANGNTPHPCVVVSNDTLNENGSTITVVPISGHGNGAIPRDWEVRIAPPDGEVVKECWAMTHHIRTIAKERVLETWGKLDTDTMLRIEDWLLWVVGIDFDTE